MVVRVIINPSSSNNSANSASSSSSYFRLTLISIVVRRRDSFPFLVTIRFGSRRFGARCRFMTLSFSMFAFVQSFIQLVMFGHISPPRRNVGNRSRIGNIYCKSLHCFVIPSFWSFWKSSYCSGSKQLVTIHNQMRIRNRASSNPDA